MLKVVPNEILEPLNFIVLNITDWNTYIGM